MKNLLKAAVLAAAVLISVAACNPPSASAPTPSHSVSHIPHRCTLRVRTHGNVPTQHIPGKNQLWVKKRTTPKGITIWEPGSCVGL